MNDIEQIMLVIWLTVALITGYYIMRKLRLIGVSPAEKLAATREEMDHATSLLVGVICPFCRSPTNPQKTNYEAWTIQTACVNCGQISWWKFLKTKGLWVRIAPFKYSPSPINVVKYAAPTPKLVGLNYIIEFPNADNVQLFKERLENLDLSIEDIAEKDLTLSFSCTQEVSHLDCLKQRGLIKNFIVEQIKNTEDMPLETINQQTNQVS